MQEWIRFKGGWQTPVPDELLTASISGQAKLLWICLKSFASKSSPQPFPKRFTLSKMLGGHKIVNKESFYKYRQELIDGGYLEPEAKQRRINGRWGSRCYTLGLPGGDSKQKSSRCLEKQDTVKPDTKKPYPVFPDTKNTSDRRITKIKEKTTTKEAAGAASGSGNFFNEKPNLGSCFLTRWCQTYQQWFKSPYLQKSEEVSQAKKVIEELRCRPKDLLAYAYRMWLNTADFDEISSEGHDPLFYQIKGSRNLRFFLSHLMEIAGEQKEPMDCAIPVKEPEFRELEEAIAEGRPD